MRSIIKPGELDEMLVIQKNVDEGAIDDNGFPISSIVDVYTLWCKVKTVSTREYVAANRESSGLTYKFIVPRDGVEIDNDMYILYGQKEWNIKHIHHIDSFFYEITAELKQ